MGKDVWKDRESISDFLKEGQTGEFLIPEYQREYSWDEDQVEKLFEDLRDFSIFNNEKEKKDNPYFLGSVVYYDNGRKKDIIDGQQRITTITLFLRALYTNLTTESGSIAVTLMKEIGVLLWKEKDAYVHDVDKNKVLIETKVAIDDYIKEFNSIMKTGNCNEKGCDNYNKNYLKLKNLIDDFKQKNSTGFYTLIKDVKENVVLLPIRTENYDTALRIFNTLNDRGLPLSDADIFKANIYKQLKKNERKDFIAKWKDLNNRAKKLGKGDLTSYFYYEMFYHRANSNDKDTTTPKLRDYYIKKNNNKLHNPKTLEDIEKIIDFDSFIKNRDNEFKEKEKWANNIEVCKLLDILSSYNIEFSKYPYIIYYLKYHEKKDFAKKYILFLKRYIALLIVKYVEGKSLNSIKDPVLKLNASIIKTQTPTFERLSKIEKICNEIYNPPSKIESMLIAILAYEEKKQKELLPIKWEIEHILPRHFEDMVDTSEEKFKIKEAINHLGNKIPLEKKLNIKASDEWLQIKKKHYKKSNIAIAKKLSQSQNKGFDIDSIEERDSEIQSELINIIKKWSK